MPLGGIAHCSWYRDCLRLDSHSMMFWIQLALMAWWLVNGIKLMSWTSFLNLFRRTQIFCKVIHLLFLMSFLFFWTWHVTSKNHATIREYYRVALSLLKVLKSRFAQILVPQDPDFDPLAATACFLDPSVGMILLNSSDTEPVLKAAQHHLLQLITEVFDPNFLCFVFQLTVTKVPWVGYCTAIQ